MTKAPTVLDISAGIGRARSVAKGISVAKIPVGDRYAGHTQQALPTTRRLERMRDRFSGLKNLECTNVLRQLHSIAARLFPDHIEYSGESVLIMSHEAPRTEEAICRDIGEEEISDCAFICERGGLAMNCNNP